MIDIEKVLDEWHLACPAQRQAVVRILSAGQRGRSVVQDLTSAIADLSRAIALQEQRDNEPPHSQEEFV